MFVHAASSAVRAVNNALPAALLRIRPDERTDAVATELEALVNPVQTPDGFAIRLEPDTRRDDP